MKYILFLIHNFGMITGFSLIQEGYRTPERFLYPLLIAIVCQIVSCTNTCYSAQNSLCQSDETVVFSCPVKKGAKTLSLCSSPKLSAKDGYLQYRFGRQDKVELEFPVKREQTQKAFRYAHYYRYQVERTAVSFDKAGYTYSIFDSYEGDTEPKVHQQGIEVTPAKNKQKSTVLACSEVVKNSLQSLSTILPCDKKDPLNMDECP